MKLDPHQLDHLADIACEAALAAGEVIRAYTPGKVAVQQKAGGDSLASQVVTEVDEKCQDAILSKLASTMDEFDLALLAEELPDDGSRLNKDYFWCIDPLDGTLPFTQGKLGYAVSIALVRRDGTPVVGVVYDPVEQVLRRAVHGQGLQVNGKSWIKPDPIPRADSTVRFYMDCSFETDPGRAELTVQIQEQAKRMGFSKSEIIIGGGAVLNACSVLDHPHAVYTKAPKEETGGGSIWDFAATACIFWEANAYAGDCFGKPLFLNNAKSLFFNHCGVCYSSTEGLAKELNKEYGSIH